MLPLIGALKGIIPVWEGHNSKSHNILFPSDWMRGEKIPSEKKQKLPYQSIIPKSSKMALLNEILLSCAELNLKRPVT